MLAERLGPALSRIGMVVAGASSGIAVKRSYRTATARCVLSRCGYAGTRKRPLFETVMCVCLAVSMYVQVSTGADCIRRPIN